MNERHVRIRPRTLTAVLVIGLLPGSTGCGGDGSTGPGPETPVGSVTVTPDSLTLDKGDTIRLSATVRDRFANVLENREVTWSSTDPSIVSVDGTGLVAGLKAGFGRVFASAGAKADTADALVLGPVASVQISTGSLRVLLTEPRALDVTVRDEAGTELTDVPVTWQSADPSVATVDDTGVVSGLQEGMTIVTARADTVSDTADIEVRKPVIFTTLSAGELHTCGTSSFDNLAYCWGSNDEGQIGRSGGAAGIPAEVAVIDSVATVSAGGAHSCAVRMNGDAFCWGANDRGQIGDGTTQSRGRPVSVTGGLSFDAITAGDAHTCALTPAGEAYCWGANGRGQLGDASMTDRTAPVLVSGGLTWVAVDAGDAHTCGLTNGGEAYCWGANTRGQVGDGSAADRSVPALVSGGLAWSAVSAGGAHSCGVTDTGEGLCWGANERGQLGDGTTDDRMTPDTVAGGLSFASISAGDLHSCGVTEGDAGFCWGANDVGQLGDGSQQDRLQPSAVSGGLPFVRITPGTEHSCGLTGEPVAYCWGISSARLGGPSAPLSGVVNIPGRVELQLGG